MDQTIFSHDEESQKVENDQVSKSVLNMKFKKITNLERDENESKEEPEN